MTGKCWFCLALNLTEPPANLAGVGHRELSDAESKRGYHCTHVVVVTAVSTNFICDARDRVREGAECDELPIRIEIGLRCHSIRRRREPTGIVRQREFRGVIRSTNCRRLHG